MDVFDAFDLTDYTFLELSRGGVAGNSIVSTHETSGVFKLRSGMVKSDNQETSRSDATLHVRPTENFLPSLSQNLVGHGIRVGGKDYEVIGQTGGTNFETGELEHYRLTLQASDFTGWEEA